MGGWRQGYCNAMQVFLYQGTQKCQEFPFVLLVVFGALMLVLFGIVLPIYILKVIYAPKVSGCGMWVWHVGVVQGE